MLIHALRTTCRSIGSLIASVLLSLLLSACVATPRTAAVAVECPRFPEIPAEFGKPLPTTDLLQPDELPAAMRMMNRQTPSR